MKRVLFICTGNTCRSPMAQALFDKYAKLHRVDAHAYSAGIMADEGAPVSENARLAIEENGVDISHHRARMLSRNDTENADVIFCMTSSQCLAVASIYPDCSEKLYIFEREIPDPYGGNLDMYKSCCDRINEQLPYVFGVLRGDNK